MVGMFRSRKTQRSQARRSEDQKLMRLPDTEWKIWTEQTERRRMDSYLREHRPCSSLERKQTDVPAVEAIEVRHYANKCHGSHRNFQIFSETRDDRTIDLSGPC